MDNVRLLSNDELLVKLGRFVEEERDRLHTFLAWLGEADRRKLPESEGFSSTFDFCIRRLKLSDDEAYRRIHVARAALIRPELLAALASGRLTLSAGSKIAPFVRRHDALAIIAQAEGKTTREIDEILAPLHPHDVKRETIRTVAVVSRQYGVGGLLTSELQADFSFRGSLALRNALDRIRHLLSHKYPKAGIGEILFEIAQEYLERHDPEKMIPGRGSSMKGRTSIPAEVRRTVWIRDGGRCSFVGPAGVRCQSRRFLEMDHVKPLALGGGHTVANLRLLCRPHNDSERRRILGERRCVGTTQLLSGDRSGKS